MTDVQKCVISGPEYPFTVPNMSYGELLLRRISEGGDDIAFVDGITEQSLTYNEIVTRCLQLGEGLLPLNFQPGDVISICSENHIDYPICLIAAISIGLSASPINFTYTEGELSHVLSILQPRLIFCSASTIDRMLMVVKRKAINCKIVLLDDAPHKNPSVIPFKRLLLKSVKTIANFPFVTLNTKEDVALILCSSGTTGLPKGVMLTHHSLVVTFFILELILGNQDRPVSIMFVPFFHGYGCLGHINSLALRGKMIFLSKFEENLYYRCIEKYRATALSVVPPVCVLLAKSPLVDNYDLSSVQEIRCGAAPLSREVSEAVVKRLNNPSIRQGYGMTETTLAAMFTPVNEVRHGGVGRLMVGLKAKVLDLKTGEALGPNQAGELCLKGELIMKGYYGNPKETAATIDKDGWLHTGDIAYYDSDEFFYIVDRLKELIKYKGYQVAPAELESLLIQNPAIKDAAVVGMLDESVGERPVAFVVKQPNARITAQEIKDYIASKVSPQKRLHGGVRFISEIPKNPSGKILRRELRKIVNPKAHL